MTLQTTQVTHEGTLGTSALMLANIVPPFPEDAAGPDIRDFFKILEQASRLGTWQGNQLIGIARRKTLFRTYDFAWRNDSVAAAATLAEFETLAVKRFNTVPISIKVEQFLNARQNTGEEVRSFASRL